MADTTVTQTGEYLGKLAVRYTVLRGNYDALEMDYEGVVSQLNEVRRDRDRYRNDLVDILEHLNKAPLLREYNAIGKL